MLTYVYVCKFIYNITKYYKLYVYIIQGFEEQRVI